MLVGAGRSTKSNVFVEPDTGSPRLQVYDSEGNPLLARARWIPGAVRLVASFPGAITYADPSLVASGLDVLTIDGKAASDPGVADVVSSKLRVCARVWRTRVRAAFRFTRAVQSVGRAKSIIQRRLLARCMTVLRR